MRATISTTTPSPSASAFSPGPPADRDSLPALVDPLMLELNDPGILTRLAAPLGSHHRACAQRVAVKDRFRESDIAQPQIGDSGPERRFSDADANHQTERK